MSRLLRYGPRATAALLTGLLVLALTSASPLIVSTALASSAKPGPTYWVALTSKSSSDRGCSSAAYHSVQSAVKAAERYDSSHHGAAPTINVCPGTYSEQVTITRSLKINGVRESGNHQRVIIELPASVGDTPTAGLSKTECQTADSATGTEVPTSVIEICAARTGGQNTTGVSVSISHVTAKGAWEFEGTCAVSMYGVLVEGGARLTLSDSVVDRIGDFPLQGCQSGVGVQAGYAPTGQVGHVVMTDDQVRQYQKNGITIDGRGSTAKITGTTVTGSGATPTIAQNGIQISFGATGSVTASTITANNYTGTPADEGDYPTYADGVLVYGGGGSVCGLGSPSPLVRGVHITGNVLQNNDVGVQLFNINSKCDASVSNATRNLVCSNSISNAHGYDGGVASADANPAGYETANQVFIGYQAGVADSGDGDTICDNLVSGTGYEQRDATSTLPNPSAPAFTRPIDVFSFAPPNHAHISGNKFDGKAYKPH
jgi:hypothetical protein